MQNSKNGKQISHCQELSKEGQGAEVVAVIKEPGEESLWGCNFSLS